MRALTLGQVREVLSSAQASRFFESWAAASDERARVEERLEDLQMQAHTAEARVRLAEEGARLAAAHAEDERRRALEPGLDAALRPFVRLEAEALARAHLTRAQEAMSQAQERRARAGALFEEASRMESELDAARDALQLLRDGAATLDGYVGEHFLFFGDAEVKGGVFLVPLDRVVLETHVFESFVLHRLAPGASLSAADAIRDRPAADVPDLPDITSDDPLEPRSEGSAKSRREGL